MTDLEPEILGQINRRIVQSFLDIVILLELRNNPLSGYDIISFINKKFHVLLSSGTVYANLYALERDGLINGEHTRRKRVYMLTERGKETALALSCAKDKIPSLIRNVFVEA